MYDKPGQPPKFKSAEELEEKIETFFRDCEATDWVPTICSLAVALDCDRQTILNYQAKEE